MAVVAKDADAPKNETKEKQDPKEATALVQESKGMPTEENKEGALSIKQLERVVVEVYQGTKPQPTPAVLEAALVKARELDDKGQPKNKHKDSESAKGWAQSLFTEKAA